ncbi:MAG: zinc ABC transporter substrate-binding protein [Proteobacteria bacterium]|nr:zinc ABC transporter substrate-binding protein [Pseudomonadota bacterium]
MLLKAKLKIIILLVALLLASPDLQAKVNIFACEPEWKALAEEIGGDYIEAFSATSAKQDPHHIRAKPSLIAKIRNADILICAGADLEIGWLPILLQKANSAVQPNENGFLMVSDFVQLIEKPKIIDRSLGDIHPQGNPHSHLNPYNILLIAKELKQRLQLADPQHSQSYQKLYDDFISKWQIAIKQWELKAQPLKGVNIVVHHRSFSYLIKWLGMNEVAMLEPKIGIPPTISHLNSLLIKLEEKPAKFIIRTAYDLEKPSKWLAAKTGIIAIELPYTVGGDEYSDDLFTLFDRIINLMIEQI